MTTKGGDGDAYGVDVPLEGEPIDGLASRRSRRYRIPPELRYPLKRIALRDMRHPQDWFPDWPPPGNRDLIGRPEPPIDTYGSSTLGWGRLSRQLESICDLILRYPIRLSKHFDRKHKLELVTELITALAGERLRYDSVYDLIRRIDDRFPVARKLMDDLIRGLWGLRRVSRTYRRALADESGQNQDEQLIDLGTPIPGLVPVTIWLSSDQDKDAVQDAVENFLSIAGLELAHAYPPESGSWFRQFVFRTRATLSTPEARLRMQKAEKALENKILAKQQAEINSAEADAVNRLLSALENTPEALIQVGSLLLIKVGGIPVARTLTISEQIYLERNPTALKDPTSILSVLQRASEGMIMEQSALPAGEP